MSIEIAVGDGVYKPHTLTAGIGEAWTWVDRGKSLVDLVEVEYRFLPAAGGNETHMRECSHERAMLNNLDHSLAQSSPRLLVAASNPLQPHPRHRTPYSPQKRFSYLSTRAATHHWHLAPGHLTLCAFYRPIKSSRLRRVPTSHDPGTSLCIETSSRLAGQVV